MPIKAIIFDLDGTAIPNDPNGHPSPRLITAVKAAQAHMKLAAATGRSITNAGYILDELGLTTPCIISGGSQIVDPRTREILWQAFIPPAAVQAILEACRPYDQEILIGEEQRGEGSPAADRTLTGPVNVIYLEDIAAPEAHHLHDLFKDIPGIVVSLVTSWGDKTLDIHITPAEGTKEHSAQRLLGLMGVPKAETAGVGDANNDVHLFNAVGHKVAMGNATGHLKSLADQTIGTVAEDGLALYLESLG